MALNYTNLEHSMFLFLERYLEVPLETSMELFDRLHNRARVDLITSLVRRVESATEAQDAVLYAVRGFELAAENRNLLVHARHHEPIDGKFILSKPPADKPGQIRWYKVSVSDVRKAADAAAAFSTYVMLVWFALHSRRIAPNPRRPQLPWPDKPPLPGKLTRLALPATPRDETPQQPPSRWLLNWGD